MKLTTLFMLAITSAITLVGCSDNDDPKNPVAVTGVTLNTSSLSLHKGESETLTATVKPENAEDKTVTWSSSDITCVSVDNTGKVTAIAIGKATVTAEAGQKSATCLITVTGIPVESVTLDKETHEMQVGETVTLKATVLPDNTDDKIITWTSSKTDVATVNEGTVSAVAAGKTVITAKAGEKTATCEIPVTARPSTPAIGDYYYSDGSYSSALETGKDPIGIIFWVGDPTKDDAILRQEHPGCTHGLVVALHETDSPWQAYYSDYDATVSAWLGNNLTGYTSLLAGYKMDDNLNKMLGYNNTKAIEAFNADEANEWWEVEIVTYVQEYRDKTKAPENSSDWYAPSVKELSLLCTGVFDGNIDDLGYEDEPDTANSLAINERLATIGSASQLSNITYWTASEEDGRTAKIINFKSGIVASSNKGNDSNLIRCILAF